MDENRRQKLKTILAKAGHFEDAETGGIVPRISTSTTYKRDADYQLPHDRLYGRADNPLYDTLEHILTEIEGAADAAVFPSGLSAMTAISARLPAGAGLVLPDRCYFGVHEHFSTEGPRLGLDMRSYRAGDLDSLEQAIKKAPVQLVWLETPANPTWEVISIKAAARLAHDAGAKLIVDATVMTPILCNPIALGADYVMHSGTKYLNGHSDVLAGVLLSALDDDDWKAIKDIRRTTGSILGPFEAWLLIRGMRTLYLRVQAASRSALAIARHFEGHDRVREVLYPGLTSHPAHEIAKAEMDTEIGFGGMLSICTGGGLEGAKKVVTSTRLFIPATSLGGIESLIEHRKPVEGPESTTPDDLLRISVGLEDCDELIADLEQALAAG